MASTILDGMEALTGRCRKRQAGMPHAVRSHLEPKLNDPALRDHPKRPEYAALYDTRALQIRVPRQKAEPFLREFAVIWERIPEARREAIRRDETGWPQETTPAVLAARVFAWMASEDFLWSSKHDAPFWR